MPIISAIDNFILRVRKNTCGEIFLFFLLAIASYFLSSLIVFPGYIPPLAAHHSDMYIPVVFVERFPHVMDLVRSYPRPVCMGVAYFLGMVGFKFTMVVLIGLTFFSAALVFYVLEKYYLFKQISLILIFFSQLIFFSLPGYFLYGSYDIGAVLASFFGILGIFFLEKINNKKVAIGVFGLCTLCSAFSKEHFLLALELYAICYAVYYKLTAKQAIPIVSIPLFSVILICFDAYFFGHTNFVGLNKAHEDAYHISLQLSSIFNTAFFYIKPFSHPIFLIAFIGCSVAALLNKKALLFFAVVSLGFACYVAYLLIPNHRLGHYYWSGMPFLMAIVPIAFFPVKNSFINRIKNIVLVLLCGLVLAVSKKADHAMDWSLAQQNINKNIIDALNKNKISILQHKNILICGLTFPFHPWSNQEFLTKYLGYSGTWGLLYNESLIHFPNSRLITIVKDPSSKEIQQYDWVFIFNGQGQLTGSLAPTEYITKNFH